MFVSRVCLSQHTDIVREDTLQEVTVTSRSAQKRVDEVQIGVEKIDIATLAKVPTLFGEKDIIKSLQLLPGVKSENEASGGYQVRGGKAAQNLILLDDATVYNAGHLMGLFSTFNDDALMGGSLYKGLVPAQLGGGTASVFDISTRSGSLHDYHFGGSIGLLSAKVVAEGPIQQDRSSFLFAGRRSYLDLFLKASEKYRDNTLHFYDANLRLNFRLSQRDMLSLSFFRGRDNMGLVDMMDMEWGNTTATANWLHTFSDAHYANTKLIYSDFTSDVGIDMLNIYYTMKGYIRHSTLQHQQTWQKGHHRLNYGLEATHLQLQSAEWDINLLHQREKREALTSALWIGDEWHIGNMIELSAGLRFHHFSVLGGAPYYQIDRESNIVETTEKSSGSIVKTYADVEPRISAKLTLNEQHSLKLGYSRTSQDIHAISGMSMSMPFDRYTMTSNIVRPEQADQVALGWFYITPKKDYDFSAETYYKNIRNVYDYRDGKAFYSEIEIERLILGGKGRAYGIELCGHKNSGPLTGWISYTLSWSENKIEGINDGRWYTASNDRRHDLAIVGMYRLSPTWDLAATWRYNTGQALTAPSAKYDIDGTTFYYYNERNGYRAPAYHRLDLSATYTKKLQKTTHIWSFGIYNAYCRYNPFTIRFKNDDKSPTGTIAEQTSLFGIVPSVSFTLKY
ncbi:MAG: TonB-dependent receptor [Prevotella sp.]|nr:TonB-dependent receptor [Prevotella sp.]